MDAVIHTTLLFHWLLLISISGAIPSKLLQRFAWGNSSFQSSPKSLILFVWILPYLKPFSFNSFFLHLYLEQFRANYFKHSHEVFHLSKRPTKNLMPTLWILSYTQLFSFNGFFLCLYLKRFPANYYKDSPEVVLLSRDLPRLLYSFYGCCRTLNRSPSIAFS